ncbi:Putative methyltransferase YrhH [Paraburkholderia ultramafica]|uniref:Methyltransferase YrhH n=1 Tax=Paraburkholderia ultramafica TaxID=1544867 RepID=A0A6S7BKF2_9BURK|nr:methyltransferase domain-containing protein [Paraburkholderia ultramafica]CAB3803515.1 Putative methyltransferase YrhH [Paraburkholderia ultramafica]
MSAFKGVLMQMFGRPHGVLGRLGGVVMAKTNQPCAAWVVDLLEIRGTDSVLEVGFGPGVGIQLLAASAKHIAGIDPSPEMLRQATVRNAQAIDCGQVDLRIGSAERLPFEENTFDKALTINSMQVWPDATAGLIEMQRVMKSGARIALGFTLHSGQQRSGLVERLAVAGFAEAKVIETDNAFCAIAAKP